MFIWIKLTCTDAHYKTSYYNHFIGVGHFTRPHHYSWNNGEDIVDEESSFSEDNKLKTTKQKNM